MEITTYLLGFEITEQIYLGSRTLVYRGIRLCDRLPVVIKILRNPFPSFSELVQFRNQYTIMRCIADANVQNLNLPNIIQTLALEPYQNGYALVMEDFGGISLKELLEQTGNLGENNQALIMFFQIALQITEALEELYRQQVIHKDIKPANILIHPQTNQVKLIDFSIASLLPRETQTIQTTNTLEGTLTYISPEQTGRMNRGIDYRSDYYSLGVTFYEMLTGELPFVSKNPMELLHCHLAIQPKSLHQVNPNIPLVLSKIVSKLMAKNAENRYQSVSGIKYDLEICLDQIQETGRIENFGIGKRDVSDRFTIPEKLYGREQEVKILLESFERVSTGSTELMLVAGFSGIGKTVVVNEVHKPIVRQKGYFIKGKYDQFNRNIPFSAFVQAFRDLMGQLLSESDRNLQTWKTKLLEAVGDNGQVIIEVIPELALLLGKQPEVTELSGSSAQNRFNLLFQKFVQVFTSVDHPLVIFLDDLQWADSASLKLLQLLMNDAGHLLILGAYRDNEVSPIHPFMLTVEELKKGGAKVNTITLEPLSQVDINRLVADTLSCDRTLAQPLTELVYQKTQGNPFFTTQFLKALHDDKFIKFNQDLGYWECDISQIRLQSLTNDVVEFMALQLQKLSPETQDVLKLAACIGSQFDLQTLAIVYERSETETATALWTALQEGLIIPINESYKFFQAGNEDLEANKSIIVPYKFLHDRVQQAAYSLISEEHKQLTHLNIGRLFSQNLSPQKQEENIFTIVCQFNQASHLVLEQKEREQLAQFNFVAGKKARAATAYNSVIEYTQQGIELLSSDKWTNQYDLMFSLYYLAIESLYLVGNLEQMRSLAAIVLQHATQGSDKAKIYEVQISAYISQKRLEEALALGMKALKELGIDFPKTPSEIDSQELLTQTFKLIPETGVYSLVQSPIMTNEQSLAGMRIMSIMIAPIYQTRGDLLIPLFLFAVQLSIKKGNNELSPLFYASYALILCAVLDDIETGSAFSNLALDLLDQFQNKAFHSRAYLMTVVGTIHWISHLRQAIATGKLGFEIGRETGDLESTAWNFFYCRQARYLVGDELSELAKTMAIENQAIQQMNQLLQFEYSEIFRQVVLNLLGDSEDSCLLTGTAIDENKLILEYQSQNIMQGLFVIYFHKLILSYLFERYEQALDNAQYAIQYIAGVTGQIVVPTLNFYDSLARISLYFSLTEKEKIQLLKAVAENQSKLERWSSFAPMNFAHKVYLVAAEKHRILGERPLAIDLYDRAIAGAKANEYLQEEALANELAAKFYLDWGKEKVAAGYMQEAYYCYARWGAKAKNNDLETRYPQLLKPILQQAAQRLNILESLSNFTTTTYLINSTSHPSSSSTSINQMLDFSTLLQISQAISKTIDLDELLQILTHTILQNSGGDRCALILPDNEGVWEVRAIATPTETQLCLEPLDQNSHLPVKLIQYVKNTQEVVIIDDLKTDLPVSDDYLMQQQPKSILCLPILNQTNLIGILYLDNHLTSGVFTSDRLLILNFLCTQAAISLENARLYQESYQYTQQLQGSLVQLQQSELRFKELFNKTTDAILLLGDQGFIDCNQSAVNLFGYSQSQDLCAIHPSQISPEFQFNNQPSFDEANAMMAIALRQGSHQFDWLHQKLNGEVFWAEVTLTLIPYNGEQILHSLVRDISDRKATEQALEKYQVELVNQKQTLRAILDGAPLWIWMINIQGKILFINKKFCTDVAVTESQFLAAAHYKDVLGEAASAKCMESDQACLAQAHLAQNTLVHCTETMQLADGQEHILETIKTLLRDDSGEVIGLIGWGIDITQQRHMEAIIQGNNCALSQALQDLQQAQLQTIQSEKMSALGNLVAGVAHEINNPIGSIVGNVGAAQDYINDLIGIIDLYGEKFPQPGAEIEEELEAIDLDYIREDLPKLIKAMKDGGDRIRDISASLRVFSRADSDQKQKFNLHEGLDSTILILRHRLKANNIHPAIEIITNYGNIPVINCFPGQLNQVFMNILANAIDALEEANEGRSYANIAANPNRITITTSLADNHVRIAIADNGKGIPEEVKAKIFEHLFTTKEVGKGTGLGLTIAHQIVVEKHRGTLSLESTLGQGTIFRITLPIS